MIQSYKINGLHCGNCVNKVKTVLAKVPEFQNVDVSLEPPVLKMDAPSQVGINTINELLATAGSFSIENMPKEIILDVGTEVRANSNSPQLNTKNETPKTKLETFRPLLLVFGYLLLVTVLIQIVSGSWNWMQFMQHYMAGFFLSFSFFKMLDLKGFSDSFQMYDLIGQRSKAYAKAYPFIELGLGILYLTGINLALTNLLCLVIVGIGTVGVVRSVLDKKEIRCACLGTVFNLPMTTVTIVENSIMIVMALGMLLLGA